MNVRRFPIGVVVLCLLPCTVLAQTVDPEALAALRRAAEQADSSALVVAQGGDIVAEWHFDGRTQPIETQSITKAIVALLLGAKVGSAELPTIDVPVTKFYPEWQQGQKRYITVRHLLTHTSCLQDVESSADEIAPAPNAVQLALAADLVCEPGTEFHYSNKAPNLLAGIVEKVFGESLERAADAVLFKPLGISNFIWWKDSAGNPYAMGGLMLTAADLAKIGTLVAHRGNFNGVQVIPEEWIEALAQPGLLEECGLLWWRRSETLWQRATGRKRSVLVARGWLGQYLYVDAEKDLVVVRQYDVTRGNEHPSVTFSEFESLADALIK